MGAEVHSPTLTRTLEYGSSGFFFWSFIPLIVSVQSVSRNVFLGNLVDFFQWNLLEVCFWFFRFCHCVSSFPFTQILTGHNRYGLYLL
jgi:hypothetical protein